MALPEAAKTQTGIVVSSRTVPTPVADGSLWSQVQARSHAEDPGPSAVWLSQLVAVKCGAGELLLAALSDFHSSYVQIRFAARQLTIARRIDPNPATVRIAHGAE